MEVQHQSLQPEVTAGDTFTTRLQVKASGSFTERVPLDIVLVMDVSGSMNWRAARGGGRRINEAKQAMRNFVQAVNDGSDERAALVTYNGRNARLIRPLQPFNRSILLSRINSLRARGSTPMGMGLLQATRELNRNGRNDSIKAIIFAGDGHHNTGPRPGRFLNRVPGDAYVYTIGVGNDVQRQKDCGWLRFCKSGERWLKDIASSGNGKGEYLFVPSASRLNQVYQDLLQKIRNTVVAENTKARLQFRPELEYVSASEAPDTVNRSQGGDAVQWNIGDLSNGDKESIEVTLRAVNALAAQPQSVNVPFPQSRLEYINPAGSTRKPIPSSAIRVRSASKPTVDITANGKDGPITVPPGEQVQIEWTSQNASSCTINPAGWSGLQGSRSEIVSAPISYTASCANQRGTSSDSVTVDTFSEISCSPDRQNVFINSEASLDASGGSGSYSWEVTSGQGNPDTGTGSSFTVSFDESGEKQITVTDPSVAGQQDTCEVFVESPPEYEEE